MRVLEEINDYSDIYQPVSEEDIAYVESQLAFTFPDELRRIFREPNIACIKELPALLWIVKHNSLGILEVNDSLHSRDCDPYPKHLVAFATNECGDWFCFDTGTGEIVYIGPGMTVEENLQDRSMVFRSFTYWLEEKS